MYGTGKPVAPLSRPGGRLPKFIAKFLLIVVLASTSFIGVGGATVRASKGSLYKTIGFRAASDVGGSSAATKPTGTATGDVVYICAINAAGSADCSAAGWTKVGGVVSTSVASNATLLRRVMDGTESWPITITNQNQGNTVVAFSNVDTTTPEDVASQSYNSDGAVVTEVPVPSVTPITPGTMLMGIVNRTTGGSVNWTMAMTERLDNNGFGVGTETRVSAGATGDRTFTRASGSDSRHFGIMVALRPATL